MPLAGRSRRWRMSRANGWPASSRGTCASACSRSGALRGRPRRARSSTGSSVPRCRSAPATRPRRRPSTGATMPRAHPPPMHVCRASVCCWVPLGLSRAGRSVTDGSRWVVCCTRQASCIATVYAGTCSRHWSACDWSCRPRARAVALPPPPHWRKPRPPPHPARGPACRLSLTAALPRMPWTFKRLSPRL